MTDIKKEFKRNNIRFWLNFVIVVITVISSAYFYQIEQKIQWVSIFLVGFFIFNMYLCLKIEKNLIKIKKCQENDGEYHG